MLYTFKKDLYPVYSTTQGYGFLKEIPQNLTQFPEFYGNFIAEQETQLPTVFMADVEAGTYNISLVLSGNCYIFSQQRRLSAVCKSRSEKSFHFSLTTGNLIAGYDKKRYTNHRIVLSFCGEAEITSIEIALSNQII